VRLLDLYCCEGGAGMGYHRAGFEVVGVDLFEDYTQARYPFESHKADAIEFVKEHGHEFDVIHASPPCQHASAGTRAQDRSRYPQLIEPTRDALIATGLPYVIENVRGSDLINPVELCGCMFNLAALDADGLPLRMERPRLFESNLALVVHSTHHHPDDVRVAGCYGGGRKAKRRPGETLAEVAPRDRHEAKYVRKGGYVPRSKAVVESLMGIDWMTWKGLHQSLPPAYTEWIGRQIRSTLGWWA
jgi:DNA (cytosine-5)-methyltransferase 1